MPPTQRQSGDKDPVAEKVADQEANVAATRQRLKEQQDDEAARAADQKPGGDASVTADLASGVRVMEGASPKYSTKPGDVTADPRTGEKFGKVGGDGLKGTYGEELLSADFVVPGVDPKRIPAEVTPGVSPDPGGDKLLAAAQAKAPSLTREFVDKMGLTEENLAAIANGMVPPPPTPGPIYTADMYRTPGGYQQTPPGVPPEDVGGNQIHRA